MTKRKSNLTAEFGGLLKSSSAPTAPIANSVHKTPREKLGELVQNLNAEQGRNWGTNWSAMPGLAKTHSYRTANTKASPVSKTQSLPGTTAARTRADKAKRTSPVRIHGKSSHSGSSLLHSTIEALHVLGEHAGNNKKVIEEQVNR